MAILFKKLSVGSRLGLEFERRLEAGIFRQQLQNDTLIERLRIENIKFMML